MTLKLSQSEIAKASGVTQQFISFIFLNKRRPSWRVAKRLAAATGTGPYVWLEGTREEIMAAIKAAREYQSSSQAGPFGSVQQGV